MLHVPYEPSLTPLSQASPGSLMPLPQAFLQWMSQALPTAPLAAPLSHASGAWMMPSPHEGRGTYALQFIVHEPGMPLLTPSSQPSPGSTDLSPQKGAPRQRVVQTFGP